MFMKSCFVQSCLGANRSLFKLVDLSTINDRCCGIRIGDYYGNLEDDRLDVVDIDVDMVQGRMGISTTCSNCGGLLFLVQAGR